MDQSNLEEFGDVVGLIAATYGKSVEPVQIKAWWHVLGHLGLEQFKSAAEICMRECEFMPTPARILKECKESHALRAAAAWETVTAVSHRGGDDLPDPLANRVVSLLGGWDEITSRTPENFHDWTRKEFLRLYVELAESERRSIEAGDVPVVDSGTDALGLI